MSYIQRAGGLTSKRSLTKTYPELKMMRMRGSDDGGGDRGDFVGTSSVKYYYAQSIQNVQIRTETEHRSLSGQVRSAQRAESSRELRYGSFE